MRTRTVLRTNPPPTVQSYTENKWGRRHEIYTRDSYVQVPWISTLNKYPVVSIVPLEQALALARLKIALASG